MTTDRKEQISRFYWRFHVEIGFVALFVAVLLLFVGFTVNRRDITHQAAEGAATHRAVCAYRRDLEQRVRDGRAFLRMTEAQRVRRYGRALGKIPPATIRASLVNEEQTIRTFSDLTC